MYKSIDIIYIRRMVNVRLIIYGDQHYDLKSEGIDRTNDIDDSHNQIIDYAINLKNENEDVLVLNMGDVFHGTRPRSEVLATAIRSFRRFERNKIDCFIIAGNHDVIDQAGRTSALEPLEAIGFNYIHIEHDIRLVDWGEKIDIVLLPHISKARAVEQGFKNAQDYIDSKAEEIEDQLSYDKPCIVIGHMNISGAKTGTETYMIKGSHEDFPKVFKESEKIDYIFNGHIHRPQIVPNAGGAPIVITGDIQTNDFGERLDTKVFFDLEVEI
jgi:DNA repair exonuclease SbcCD nuclease subunit